MNLLTIAGNVGQEPRQNSVNGNDGPVSVLNFSVGVTEHVRGEKKTTWVDCSLWGKRADALAPYIAKGSKVTVSGPVAAEIFTPNSGETQAKLKLRVQEITLQDSKKQDSQQGGQSQPAQGQGGGAPVSDEEFDRDVPF